MGDTIKDKPKVFISSMCDGRYSIVRKALEELLLETGMLGVYVFETAPGGSQSMPEAYLHNVDRSDLCIFLISNKDGISDAVAAEHKRAKTLNKKRIYVFCNTDCYKPTSLQKEVESEGYSKFRIVNEFSDITKTAYESVMNDIVARYIQPDNLDYQKDDAEKDVEINEITVTDNYIIDKQKFKGFGKTKNELTKIVTSYKFNHEDNSEIDDLSKEFLSTILCNKKFDAKEFDKLSVKVIELHDEEFKEIIELRFKALKLYFEDNIEDCIKTLKQVLDQASSNSKVPNWISNNIAIDLRNMLFISAEKGNEVEFINEGQRFINENCETVFFPILDKAENDYKDEIIKRYYKKYTQSPNTINLSSQITELDKIAECFCISLIYGSITNINFTRNRIIDALFPLCYEYSEHDLYLNLVKMLIIEGRDKDLDKLIRTYNKKSDILNFNDIENIKESINCIPIDYHKKMSELLLFNYFGYCFSDQQYEKSKDTLLKYADCWLEDDNGIFNLGKYFFDAFISNTFRLDRDSLVEFILKAFSSSKTNFYDQVCILSKNIDYNLVSPENQKEILNKSIELIGNYEGRMQRFELHLLNFRLTANIEVCELDKAIKNKMQDFYTNEYYFEIQKNDRREFLSKINNYVLLLDQRNKQQGINGRYTGCNRSNYECISYIINKNEIHLIWDELQPILEVIKDILLSPKQGYMDKCCCLQLLVFLKNNSEYDNEFDKFIKKLQNQEEIILDGKYNRLEKDLQISLKFCYQFTLYIFNNSNLDKLKSMILNIPSLSEYEIIECLNFIALALKKYNYINKDDSIILFIVQLASMMSNHKELQIRVNAVKCLVQLTHSKYKDIVLPQLSTIMDNGTYQIKVAILSRVKLIKDDESGIVDYIIQKGRVDNNYLVKKTANEV